MNRFLDLDLFVREGYLIDLNRFWAHPLGLSIELGQHKETGEIKVTGFVDLRYQPGGAWYGERMPQGATEKAKIIAERRKEIQLRRMARHGSAVEQIPGTDDSIVVEALADPEGAHEAIAAIAGECVVDAIEALAAASAVDAGDVPEDLKDWIEATLPGLIFRATSRAVLSLFISRGGRAWIDPEKAASLESERSEASEGMEPFSRMRQISENITAERFRVLEDGTRVPRPALIFELFEEERKEALELAERIDVLEQNWIEKSPGIQLTVKTVLARFEAIWGMAQPEMKFWRNDPEARKAFEKVKPMVKEQIAKYKARRTDYQLMMAGECTAAEVEEPEALLAKIKEEYAAQVEREKQLNEDLHLLGHDMRRYKSAIAALEDEG